MKAELDDIFVSGERSFMGELKVQGEDALDSMGCRLRPFLVNNTLRTLLFPTQNPSKNPYILQSETL
jgi:hypothetical protein